MTRDRSLVSWEPAWAAVDRRLLIPVGGREIEDESYAQDPRRAYESGMVSFAPLSQQAQTAYAELVERLIRDAGDGKPGAIVRKRSSGNTYVYAQHHRPLGATQTIESA